MVLECSPLDGSDSVALKQINNTYVIPDDSTTYTPKPPNGGRAKNRA